MDRQSALDLMETSVPDGFVGPLGRVGPDAAPISLMPLSAAAGAALPGALDGGGGQDRFQDNVTMHRLNHVELHQLRPVCGTDQAAVVTVCGNTTEHAFIVLVERLGLGGDEQRISQLVRRVFAVDDASSCISVNDIAAEPPGPIAPS